MTHELVHSLGKVQGSVTTRLLGACLVLLVLPFALVADFVRRSEHERRLARVAAMETARCPQGHENALVSDGWTCSCGVTSPGHAFLPCPACSELGNVTCACSLTVRNPLLGGSP